MSKKKNKTPAQLAKELETIERATRVIEIKKSGASFRVIAKKLKEQGVADVSYQTVRRDFQDAMHLLREHRLEMMEEYFELQIERAESLMLAFWILAIGKAEKIGEGETAETKYTKPSVSAAYVYLAVWSKLNELLGFTGVQRHEITGKNGEPIQSVELSLAEWRKQAAARREQAAKTQELFAEEE